MFLHVQRKATQTVALLLCAPVLPLRRSRRPASRPALVSEYAGYSLSCGAANPISLVAQTGSTLGTAASQHLAAIAGRHSLSEAMLLLSVELLGLIGSQHVKNPPFRLYALKLLNCRCPGYPIPIDSSRHPRLSRARNPIGFIPIGNFPVSFYGIPYQQASLLFTSCFLITWLVQIRFFFTEKLKQEIKLQNKKRQGISLAP